MQKPARRGTLALVLGLFWMVTYTGALYTLKRVEMGFPTRLVVALLPVVVFGGAIVATLAAMRSLDELERRIHFEALGIAFPLTVLLLMALGMLERVIDLPPEDWSYRHVWPYLSIFYFIGLAFSRKRYE